jgi:isopentenyl diphosphate isomerase/L-lactate dehydrogenase-like FMN-dependent dehydrogenase
VSVGRARNIADLRRLARARLPRVIRDYVEGGAEDHLTLRANREALEVIRFAPRALVDVSRRSLETTLFGRRYDAPFGIAPIGAAGLVWHDAEIALARAAHDANLPAVLSTHSLVPLVRVAREAGGAPWFQLYMPNNRIDAANLVALARDTGCEALVLTVDVPVGGNREYNERNGFCVPPRFGPRLLLDGLLHPRWLASVYLRRDSGLRAAHLSEWGTRRDRQCWDDFAWLRRAWPHKLLLKGILTADDALLALRHGADGVFVSNHGGRQLDGAPAAIEALPAVVAAVGGRMAVLVDGGFRRGADIVKALALGADMVFLGRAALYGAAAGGEPGVRRALEILRGEVDRVLALLGCPSADSLGPRHVRVPGRALFGLDGRGAGDAREERDLVGDQTVEFLRR